MARSTMLKKVREKNPGSNSYCDLFWAMSNPPCKFGGNPFSSFCVILLKNQPTHGWEQNLLGDDEYAFFKI